MISWEWVLFAALWGTVAGFAIAIIIGYLIGNE